MRSIFGFYFCLFIFYAELQLFFMGNLNHINLILGDVYKIILKSVDSHTFSQFSSLQGRTKLI